MVLDVELEKERDLHDNRYKGPPPDFEPTDKYRRPLGSTTEEEIEGETPKRRWTVGGGTASGTGKPREKRDPQTLDDAKCKSFYNPKSKEPRPNAE